MYILELVIALYFFQALDTIFSRHINIQEQQSRKMIGMQEMLHELHAIVHCDQCGAKGYLLQGKLK